MNEFSIYIINFWSIFDCWPFGNNGNMNLNIINLIKNLVWNFSIQKYWIKSNFNLKKIERNQKSALADLKVAFSSPLRLYANGL